MVCGIKRDFVIFHALKDEGEAQKILERLKENEMTGELASDIPPESSAIDHANNLARESCIVFFLVTDDLADDCLMLRVKDEEIFVAIYRTAKERHLIPLFLVDKRKLKNRNNPVFAGLMSRQGLNVNNKYFDQKIEKLKLVIKNTEHCGTPTKSSPEQPPLDGTHNTDDKSKEDFQNVDEKGSVEYDSIQPSVTPRVASPGDKRKASETVLEAPKGKRIQSAVKNWIEMLRKICSRIQDIDDLALALFKSGVITEREYTEICESGNGHDNMYAKTCVKSKRLMKILLEKDDDTIAPIIGVIEDHLSPDCINYVKGARSDIIDSSMSTEEVDSDIAGHCQNTIRSNLERLLEKPLTDIDDIALKLQNKKLTSSQLTRILLADCTGKEQWSLFLTHIVQGHKDAASDFAIMMRDSSVEAHQEIAKILESPGRAASSSQ